MIANKCCDFLRGQRGGGFVHDDDPRVDRQGLGNLDRLLLGDGQFATARLRIDRQPELLKEPLCLLLLLAPPG